MRQVHETRGPPIDHHLQLGTLQFHLNSLDHLLLLPWDGEVQVSLPRLVLLPIGVEDRHSVP